MLPSYIVKWWLSDTCVCVCEGADSLHFVGELTLDTLFVGDN